MMAVWDEARPALHDEMRVSAVVGTFLIPS